MITPRRTRLCRAPDLAGIRAHLIDAARGLDAAAAADTFVLVPTRAAGEQLRRTLEDHLLSPQAPQAWLPIIGTRGDLYEHLASRLERPPRVLSGFEREVLLAAAAREVEDAGLAPPFHVRPALVAEMLALYDQIRRLHRTVDDFDRLLSGELEPAAESDQGAAQLLEQTRFLAAAFRGYEDRVREGGACDEHALRAALVTSPSPAPLRRLVVTVGDRIADAEGLWPADHALLTSVPGLEDVILTATDGGLAAGYLDRLRLAFLELDEGAAVPPAPPPVLVVPPPVAHERALVFAYRDREEELEAVARRLKAERRAGAAAPLHRTALVVARPLPYLYLARGVFANAGVPFEALDTLPLAAEAYAAALDLVLEAVASGFTRRALTALLRSPHLRFSAEDAEIERDAIIALDAALADARYLGGVDRLEAIVAEWAPSPAAAAAVAVASRLAPLAEPRPFLDQLDLIRDFLDRHDRPLAGDLGPDAAPVDARRQRARAGVIAAVEGLREAYRRHDPGASGTVHDLAPSLRRWLGAQTFATRTGEAGLQVLDPQAARFGDFDDVQLMGLVEGEWPERPRRTVFYPQALLAHLEPVRPERVELHAERDRLRADRAAFRDLARMARRRSRLSTFALEADAVVEPSVFVDEAAGLDLEIQTAVGDLDAQVFLHEAVAAGSANLAALVPDLTRRWAELRRSPPVADPAAFQGQAGDWVLPRVSVSRLERYLKCPFQFFVSNVLQVDEEPEDDDTRSPLERGRFLHEVFETFFHEWQARGHGRITPATIGEAEAIFADVCGPALASLPPAESALERARLFGSAVGPGIAARVFALEAERGVEIRERFMEYELDGAFTFSGGSGAAREVTLRAKIDRVDLLADGTFRLIDYKTKYVPDIKVALQLPIYSACVRARLSEAQGRDVPPSEAMYLSFEGRRGVVPLERKGASFADLVAEAEARLVQTLDDIAAGRFPPRPETKSLCAACAFVGVCRTPGGLGGPAAEEEADRG